MTDIISSVEGFVKANNLIPDGAALVVGLSGGCDSVGLLHILAELSKRGHDYRIFPVHVNHMIRGEEAKRDEDFCRELCNGLGLSITVFSEDIPLLSKELNMSEEEAGRKVRYECFRKVLKETGGDLIAVAHHMDDSAETVLFNLARGTRLSGVSGIKALSGDVVRPLLCLKKQEIEEYLRKRGTSYVTDSTNNSLEYSRNIIRHRVLPGLDEALGRSCVSNINAFAEYAGELLDFVRQTAIESGCVTKASGTVHVDIKGLRALNRVVRSEAIVHALSLVYDELKDIGSGHIEEVLRLCELPSGKCICLPLGVRAIRSYDEILIGKDSVKGEDECDYKVTMMDFDTFIRDICRGSFDVEVLKSEDRKFFDLDKLSGEISLRRRRDGDYMIIDRAGHRKKLSDILTDEKIDRAKRDDLWVVACDDNVLWAIGVRGGLGAMIDSDTKRVVMIDGKEDAYD